MENRPTRGWIGVVDHNTLMRVAVPVLQGIKDLFHVLPAIDPHGRGLSTAALVIDEAWNQPALTVDFLGIVRRVACGLNLLFDLFTVLHLSVFVIEVNRVKRFHQRQVKNREIHRLLTANSSVVMPSVIRCEHHIAGTEKLHPRPRHR